MARRRFRLAPFRSPLLRPLLTSSGYVRCFSSPAYPPLDYVFIQGSHGSPPCGVPPFGDPRLPARARLPEAFRCYATSFFGTNDLGIHPTPSVTVTPARGRPRRRSPVTHSSSRCFFYLSHTHANAQRVGSVRHTLLLVFAPHLSRCYAAVPDCCLTPARQQAITTSKEGWWR